MSLFEKLFGIAASASTSSSASSQAEHPLSNCPSNCGICPSACDACKPFKEKMVDAIYNVEHMDEIVAKYEVDTGETTGQTFLCPHCGASSTDLYTCEYCGSMLQEGNGKIKVKSASEIPNPILECQDLIFDRYEAVSSYTSSVKASEGILDAIENIASEGVLDTILSKITGGSEDYTATLGSKMTQTEIEEMAAYYGVDVSAYLTGLDNGKYLTLSMKDKCEQVGTGYASSGHGTVTAASAVAAAAASLFSGSGTANSARPERPPMPPQDGRNDNGSGPFNQNGGGFFNDGSPFGGGKNGFSNGSSQQRPGGFGGQGGPGGQGGFGGHGGQGGPGGQGGFGGRGGQGGPGGQGGFGGRGGQGGPGGGR